jgi:TolB protein
MFDRGQMVSHLSVTLVAALAIALSVAGCRGEFDPPEGRIAFVSKRDGDHEIYVMNSDGSEVSRLTNSPGPDQGPVWSPDGRRIAFESFRDGGKRIFVMNADGTAQTNVSHSLDSTAGVAWSPDGTQIAFTSLSTSRRQQIWIVNSDGSGGRPLTGLEDERSPTWSPDGRRIAFIAARGVVQGSVRFDLYVVNADGSGRSLLASLDDSVFNPAWSPDGKRVAFDGGLFDSHINIYTINADGTGLKALTDNEPGSYRVDLSPRWSPNGKYILFDSPLGGSATFVMDADGSNQRRLNTGTPAFSASWAPNSNYLVMQCGDPGVESRVEICVRRRDGPGFRSITNSQGVDFDPVWSPFVR